MTSFENGEYVMYLQHMIEEDPQKDRLFIVTESDTRITKVMSCITLHEQGTDLYSIPTLFLRKAFIFQKNASVAWNNKTEPQPFGKCYCGSVPPLHIYEDGTEESSLKFLNYRPSTDEFQISVRLAWGDWPWLDLWAHSTNFVGSTV